MRNNNWRAGKLPNIKNIEECLWKVSFLQVTEDTAFPSTHKQDHGGNYLNMLLWKLGHASVLTHFFPVCLSPLKFSKELHEFLPPPPPPALPPAKHFKSRLHALFASLSFHCWDPMLRAWQNSLVHDTSKDYFPIGKFGPYPRTGSGSFWKKQASGLPSLPCWAKDTY